MPSLWFVWKIWDFLVARGQKLGARGHRALLEHSPAIAPGVPWGCLTLLQNLAALQVKALWNPAKMRGWRSRVWLIDMTLKDETLKGKKGTHGYLCQGENHLLFIHYPFIINSNAFKKPFSVRLLVEEVEYLSTIYLASRNFVDENRRVCFLWDKKNNFYICMRKFLEHKMKCLLCSPNK